MFLGVSSVINASFQAGHLCNVCLIQLGDTFYLAPVAHGAAVVIVPN